MCIPKFNIEAAALKTKSIFGPASPSEEKCAYLNWSNIHGKHGVKADLPYFRCASGWDALNPGHQLLQWLDPQLGKTLLEYSEKQMSAILKWN